LQEGLRRDEARARRGGGFRINGTRHLDGTEVNMTEKAQDTHRHHLLSLLFGSNVPEALEGQLLRTADVATLFQVSERTVSEWAKRGQIPSVRTPGGHRRYPADGIRNLLQAGREGDDRSAQTAKIPDSITELRHRRPASA
jgi:excisionase family DNA binding protein